MKPPKLIKKEETFEFEYSIETPLYGHRSTPFTTHRIEYGDGEAIWFGNSINWKRIDGIWQALTTNSNAKPLEKYLPDMVYGEDRMIWVPCEMPEYEKLYNEYYKSDFRDKKINSII